MRNPETVLGAQAERSFPRKVQQNGLAMVPLETPLNADMFFRNILNRSEAAATNDFAREDHTSIRLSH